jgi:hypothetical protein
MSKQEDAHKRAVEDYSQFSQYARSCAQFAFGANGGAAAALLSFSTSIVKTPLDDNTKLIIKGFSFASSFYLFGVLISLFSMYLFAVAKKKWGDAWDDASSQSGSIDYDGTDARGAHRLEKAAWSVLFVTAIAFAVGSGFAVSGFFRLIGLLPR